MQIASLLLAALPAALAATAGPSYKRGLVYVPSQAHPQDDRIWFMNGSDLNWYYTYGYTPVNAFQGKAQFVPMLWGLPKSDDDTTFLDTVTAMKKSGQNITHVLSFNEPDGTSATGGSNISPAKAAAAWIRHLEPLRAYGIKLGAPSVTGAPSGFNWTQDFFTACNGSCHADFMPIHWYDNFGGLASHMGQYREAFPNMTQWITEYAYANQDMSNTQDYFNMSAEYFDRIDYVERYSYFGSFRQDVSNVGYNVPMLDPNGKLTQIGSWYTRLAVGTTVSTGGAGNLVPHSVWALAAASAFFFML